MAKKSKSDLPSWRIILIRKKGEALSTVKAKDAASAIEAYAKAHDRDPKRLMALRIEE